MNMMKTLFVSLLFSVAGIVSANVNMEMFQMNRQMSALMYAENVADFNAGAAAFIQAAMAAKAKMPASLEDDPSRFEGYQQAMQELIEFVQQAQQRAEQGQLDEAKRLVKQLQTMKNVGHHHYK